MPILADIRALEEAVADLLGGVAVPTPADRRVREAVAEAVVSLLDEAGFTAADLDTPAAQAQIRAALATVYPDWDDALRLDIGQAVGDVVGLAAEFYADQGVDTVGLREAAGRSALARTVTAQLELALQAIHTQLAQATIDALRQQILAGTVDRTALAAEIERVSGVHTTFARTQAQAAVGGLNQAYREETATRAGLTFYHYYGSVQNNTRPFCRIHIGYVFPKARVEQMRNGMLEPVLIFKGGFRCRHAWLPVNPDWDPALAARVVDEEPTEISIGAKGRGRITVVAPADRLARLQAQIPLATAGFVRFYDAETNPNGFVGVHEDWHAERMARRAGSKKRGTFDAALADALARAEAGERVLLRVEAATPFVGIMPSGTAVSRALTLPKKGDLRDLGQTVLDAIDTVHGDGPLPTIPLKPGRSVAVPGKYRYTRQGVITTAKDILATPGSRHPEFTLAHEIGHFIDQQGLAGGILDELTSTDPNGVLKPWLTAVMQTTPVKTLNTLRRGQKVPGVGRYPLDHIKYLLAPEELWARSYAQYVAVRSGNRTLLAQMEAERGRSALLQWPDDEFGPVADAIDTLFLSLKWRTRL